MRFLTRLKIPRERAIDAAPIAMIVTLLCMPFLPRLVPIALLHCWLWLRHPRNRSRYVVGLVVIILYAMVSIAPPMYENYVYRGKISAVLPLRRSEWSFPLLVLAATGIVPLFYRLFSRRSIQVSSDNPAKQEKDSRGGIGDTLILTVFCAVVLVMMRQQWWGEESPIGAMLLACICFLFSILAVLSMRFVTRSNAIGRWAAAVSIILGGMASLVVLLAVANHVIEEFLGEWRGVRVLGQQYRDSGETLVFSLTCFPLFALLCRRCGISLSRPSDQRVLSESGWFYGLVGKAFVLLGLLLFFFTPCLAGDFAFVGWPFHCVYLSDAPSANSTNGTLHAYQFSAASLAFDLIFAAVCFQAMFPPPWIKRRISPRARRMVGIATAICFFLMFIYTTVTVPLLNQRLASSVTRGSVSVTVEDTSIPAVLTRMAKAFVFGRRISGDGRSVMLDGAGTEEVDRLLRIPRLRFLSLNDCDVSEKSLSRLSGSPFLETLEITRCRITGDVAGLVESLPRLRRLRWNINGIGDPRRASLRFPLGIESYELVCSGGPVPVPTNAKSITVCVQNPSRPITINSAELEQLSIVSASKGDPLSSAIISLIDLPKLAYLNLQRDISPSLRIDNAPSLVWITSDDIPRGFFSVSPARLTSLDLTGTRNLERLEIDLANCESIKTGPLPALRDLVLVGRQETDRESVDRLPATRVQSLLSGVGSCSTESLVLTGMEINDQVLQSIRLSRPLYHLAMDDCELNFAVNPTSIQRLQVLRFDAPQIAPTDQQWRQVSDRLSGVSSLSVDCSRLTRFDFPSLVPGADVHLRNAMSLKSIAPSVIAKVNSLTNEPVDEWDAALIKLVGPVINQELVAAIEKRVQDRSDPISYVSLSGFNTTEESGVDLNGIDWGTVEVLEIRDAQLDGDAASTWALPNTTDLFFTRCNLPVQTIPGLLANANKLEFLLIEQGALHDQTDDVPFMSMIPEAGICAISFNGGQLTKADVDIIRQLDSAVVDLRGCRLPQETTFTETESNWIHWDGSSN